MGEGWSRQCHSFLPQSFSMSMTISSFSPQWSDLYTTCHLEGLQLSSHKKCLLFSTKRSRGPTNWQLDNWEASFLWLSQDKFCCKATCHVHLDKHAAADFRRNLLKERKNNVPARYHTTQGIHRRKFSVDFKVSLLSIWFNHASAICQLCVLKQIT